MATAEGHHLLLTERQDPARHGRALLPILPGLDPAAALEATAIHSVARVLDPHDPLITRPPYRNPHHTSTPAILCGGAGRPALPGEIALAHQGVLHLTDATGFSPGVLDLLRQPVNDRQIAIEQGDGTDDRPLSHVSRFPDRIRSQPTINNRL